ncbi:type II secretion system protein GspM [Marinobacterium mangrovicola]|uniref:General secretion pathway protein M n=1 Tax=Marinobacterium mangrovicola TaxID=1476959 RepID=A0A4R1GKW4_9GAMM|nr:type II secretion system protein GspM [Marinobacterium mangrovicola]TCK08768.1 general secretion pathway protein M [Marinobacterium mangrovicola]
MTNLKPGQSRFLAVALLVVVTLLLIRILLVPLWVSWSDYAARIDALENRLAVYERLAEGLPEAKARLAALQANQPSDDWYLAQATPALAAAGLQQLLHRQVGIGGAQVISTQILNRDDDSPLQPVSIQVHLRGELNDLVDLLYNIESGRPVLFVDNLRVLANPRRQISARVRNQRDRAAAIPALDVRFDLIGYTGQEVSQ